MRKAAPLIARFQMCCADVLLNWIGMETLDGVPKEVVLHSAPLTNLVKMINEMPAVAAWNADKNAGKLPWF